MNNSISVFVLKQTDYREHDVIVQALSKEYGVISLMIKGMKKQTSKLAYAFQLFSYTNIHIDYVANDKIHTVKQASVIDSHRMLREDLDCLAITSVVAELTLKFAQSHDLFDEFMRFVYELKQRSQKLTIMNLYLAKLLSLEGNSPMVDGCVMCNHQKDIVSISLEEGGFVCQYCNQTMHLPLYDVNLLQAYRVIHKASFDVYDKLDNYDVNQFALTRLLLDALKIHSGISTKSSRFLYEYYSQR